MSVRLTTSLSQRLVLTPQLRQRIEMLQMTSLELTDLIQQQLTENPVLEEVATQEEARELAEKIIDHMASGGDLENFEPPTVAATGPELGEPSSNGAGATETEAIASRETESDFISGDTEMDFAGSDNESAGGETSEESAADDTRDAFEEVDFGREFQDYLDPGYKTQEFEYKEDAPTFEQFLTRAPSLAEHLEWQLHMDQAEGELCKAAECVIGNLDEEGRLKATNEEMAALGGWPEEMVEQARAVVMKLEPVGCGARDVRECLLAQLEARGETDRLANQLIRDHLEALQQHKLPHLSKQIGIDIETLAAELQFIRTLDPFPGRRYSSEEPILISPEIYIEKLEENGEYVIYFADDGSPRLRISPSYQQMLAQASVTKETRNFIKEKMRSAVDLLRNIEHRRQTIYRVVESIVHRQKEFLDKGVEYIKPMMLKDIAEDIGMHLSTVSRVVNRKYAHTPQGVIELRRFFTEGMLNEDGEEVSTRIIKLKIKKLIEEEDSHNPITDDQVVRILVKDGIKLSRRTVAKYRDQMHIPGSRERRAIV
jgi:RNA polymerase sigma-54 factor